MVNDHIIFYKDAGIFVGRVVQITEKAVKVDYCFEPLSSNGVTVFTYTTWIPKSVIVTDERGMLTVKKWFAATGLKKDKIYHIKKYFIKGEEKVFV